jgi:hypothetical protein
MHKLKPLMNENHRSYIGAFANNIYSLVNSPKRGAGQEWQCGPRQKDRDSAGW